MGPEFGPVIGGFINYYANWRRTFYVMIIWAFVQWLLIAVFVPETYHPVLNLGVSRCFIEWLLSLCPQRDIVDCLILDTSRAYSGNFRYLHE